MKRIARSESSNHYGNIKLALLIFPPIAFGVLAMGWNGVSPFLWGQQIAAWVILLLVVGPLQRLVKRIPETAWSAILTATLAVTLLGSEANGARRWLDMGFFSVNAAMLVLPALLLRIYRVKFPHPAIVSAALVLSIQPDLSQMTALGLAVLPLLWMNRHRRLWTFGTLLILIVLEIICIGVPITVQPVSYCEGILQLLGNVSGVLQLLGIAVLAAVPLNFLYCGFKQGKMDMLSIAIYYAVSMGFVLSGEYPVPFMGYGLSSIAGYYLACACRAEE